METQSRADARRSGRPVNPESLKNIGRGINVLLHPALWEIINSRAIMERMSNSEMVRRLLEAATAGGGAVGPRRIGKVVFADARTGGQVSEDEAGSLLVEQSGAVVEVCWETSADHPEDGTYHKARPELAAWIF